MNSEQLLLRIRDEAQQALERVELRSEKIDLICYLIQCLKEKLKWPGDGTHSTKAGS